MNVKLLICFALIANTTVVYAEPPFIDYQWKSVLDACIERAKDSLVTTGFKLTQSGKSEVVGTKGDYQGVIACIGEESEIAVFTVGGPNYEQAKKWAVKMKENF